MFVFGLVAVAFAAYGMATVEKSVTDGAFNVLASISAYTNRAFDTLDGLLDTIGGTSDMCAWPAGLGGVCGAGEGAAAQLPCAHGTIQGRGASDTCGHRCSGLADSAR